MRLPFSPHAHVPFTPGDYLVLGALGLLCAVGFFWLLAELSLTFTITVPARGGEYREVIVGTPRFVNPILAISDADRDLTELTFAGLMRRTAGGELVPEIAENYTLSEDGRVYTFTIRSDAQFHDKTPVTASDVAFTVSLAKNPSLKSPKRANWEGVETTVTDERTITFTLKEPYALFLDNTRIGILPKHLWEGVSVEEMPFSRLNVEPVGAGPYRVERLVTGSAGIPIGVVLRSFDQSVREPYINTIELTFVTDQDAQIAAMRADAGLGGHSVPPSEFQNHALHEAVMGRVFSVFFNHNQNDLFADAVVRRALDESLDRSELVAILIGGYGTPASGPLPPAVSEEPPVGSGDHVGETRALLAEEGWKEGVDGIMQKSVKKSTKRLAFSLTTGTAPELKAGAEHVAEVWRTIGADVTTQFFDANDLQQNVIRPRKFDALLFGEVVAYDADLFAFWDSSQRNDPGLNIALYTNTAVDKLLREARTEPNVELRRALLSEAAETISNEHAAVFLYSPHFLYLVPEEISGITLGTIVTPADRFLSVSEWYVRTERVWPFLSDL